MRSLNVNTVRSFAETLRLMATSRVMVENDDFATKREAYYISKNWGHCSFDNQAESDATMDDIEALAAMHGLSREQLRFYPESHGGSVAGRLIVVDRNPATGEAIDVDCARFGSGAYSIPHAVEHLGFRTDAQFILQRLNKQRFWERARCIIVELGGVPTRATRRLLSDKQRLPIYCFVDCDPYGFTNIYRTLKVGSGSASIASCAFPRRDSWASHRRTSSISASRMQRIRLQRLISSVLKTRRATIRSSRLTPNGSPQSSNCSTWGFAPSSRRSLSGASTT